MSALRSSMYFTSAVAAVPTERVLVKSNGVSMVPSSFTCTRPMLLPKPFITWLAAGHLSWNVSPVCGSIAVTPVFMPPSCRVTWPTLTPGTSVILFSLPFSILPSVKPKLLCTPIVIPPI